MKLASSRIPTIDLFAGPGGLSEGFWRTGKYDVCLSIEKNEWAHETLRLRSFFHQFPQMQAPSDYYRLLAGDISISELYSQYPVEARAAESEAWLAELGSPSYEALVEERLSAFLQNVPDRGWMLIGGPPCQAYSLVGRARRRSDPNFEKDPRHTLYKQYLRIIAKHRPTVFVMENVTGILTS